MASDHTLMIARISLKLKAASPKANPAFDSAKLSTPAIRNVFALTLSNKFEALALDNDTDASLESTWNTIKEVYSQTAAATVGYVKRPKDQWLSERTWNLIGDRRNLRQQLLNGGEYNDTVLENQLYRDLDKLVKRSARGDKRILLEEKAAMAEEVAKRGDSRAVYKITNEIVGKSRNINGPVKDASCKTFTDPSEIAEVWALHFEKVLNRPHSLNPPDIPVTPCLNLQISTEEPSDVEISLAACKLKNGRAAGRDRISAEMIKTSLTVCMTVWLTLFASIWKSEKVPDDWTKSTLIKLFKKGDATKCDNWRGISLISTPGKLFAQIILRRIQTALDSHLRDEQHGFRPSRSCTDLIYVLRIMIEEFNEWRQKMYLIFVDFEKAFDSIDRNSLWKILQYYGIPEKIVSLIVALYENTECCVRTQDGNTRYFRIMSGVKHGCVLSPLLFVLVIDYVLRDCTGFSIQIGEAKKLADLDFADDIAMMERNKAKLQDLLNTIRENARRLGLKINTEKTKSMATTNSPLDMKCGDSTIEQVVEFRYLGNSVENSGSSEREVQQRIGQASGAFNRLKPVWRSKKHSLKLKLRQFNSNVLSALLYSSECWKLNQQQQKRILAFENNCLRRILNIDWREHVTNQIVRSISGQPRVTDVIRQRR